MGELISIIVPVYNIESYVEKCVDSLTAQTYKDLEIILVDDGSTDASGRVCDECTKRDSRVKAYHKPNGGLSDARNYGIDRANGSYLGFIDGDDWIHPQMFELLHRMLKDNDADMSACRCEQNDPVGFLRPIEYENVDVEVIDGTCAVSHTEKALIIACNKLYKKELFDDIRYPLGKLHEDEFVIHRLFRRCRTIAVTYEPLYFYETRSGSITSKVSDRNIRDLLAAFEDRVRFAVEDKWTEAIPAVVNRYCRCCLETYEKMLSGQCDATEYTPDMMIQSAAKMISDHPGVRVDGRYRAFARSYASYEKYMSRQEKYHRFRVILSAVLRRLRTFDFRRSSGQNV